MHITRTCLAWWSCPSMRQSQGIVDRGGGTMRRCLAAVLLLCCAPAAGFADENRKPVRLRGAVIDADTGRPLACRIYLQATGGEWFFPKSESPQGSALPYRKN